MKFSTYLFAKIQIPNQTIINWLKEKARQNANQQKCSEKSAKFENISVLFSLFSQNKPAKN